MVAFLPGDSGLDQVAAQGPGPDSPGVPEVLPRRLHVTVQSRTFSQLAVVMGDLDRLLARARVELAAGCDGLFPVPLPFIDIHQVSQRRYGHRRARLQLAEEFFRPVEESRAEIVAGEGIQCLVTVGLAEIGPGQQILVDPDCPVHLAPAPEQVPECEMRLQRFVVHLGHPDEQFQRLVGLPIEYQVQAAQIVGADG